MAASVESAFVLIDRASGTIRQIRRELRELQVDAKQAGRSLDDLSGPNRARQMEAMAREQRAMGNETRDVGREFDRTEKSMGRTETRLQSLRSKTRDAHLEFSVLGKVISFMKWPAMIAGAGGALQVLSSLTAGAVALLPRLLDLSGAAAGYGSVLVGLGASMGVVKLATSDLTKAYGGNQAALKELTPQARAFLQELKGMRPVIQSIRSAAQGGLFPGVSDLLGNLRTQAPALRGIVRQVGGDVGNLARFLGRQISAPGFTKDLGTLVDSGSRSFGAAARGGFYFAQALERVLIAAQPLTDWLGTAFVHLGKLADQEALVAQQTGSLGPFFDRAKQSIQLMWDVGKHAFMGLRGVIEAARGSGDSLWASIDRAARRFDRWANSVTGQTKLRRWFDDMRPVLSATVGLIGDLVKGIAGLTQGPLASDLIQALRDAGPAIGGAVKGLVQNFGPAAVGALSAVVKLFADLAGNSGPLTLVARAVGAVATAADKLYHALGPLGPVLATALGTFGILRKMKVFDVVDSLRLKWLGVAGAAKTATDAEAAAVTLGGGVAGRGPMVAGVPIAGAGAAGAAERAGVAGEAGAFLGPAAAAGAGGTLAAGASAGVVASLLRNGAISKEEAFALRFPGGRFGTPVLGELSAASAAEGGLLARGGSALAGVGTKALGALGKIALPLAVVSGGLGALGTPGGVGNRVLGGLNAATFGLGGRALNVLSGGIIPSAPVAPGARQTAGGRFAQNVIGGLSNASSLPAQRRTISGLQQAIRLLPGNDAFNQNNADINTATRMLQAELKRRQAILHQATLDANRQLDAVSIKHAQTLVGQFGQAFNILSRAKGPQRAMDETVGNVIGRMKHMRKSGQIVLGDAMLAWADQQRRNNPQLEGQYDRLVNAIKNNFTGLGKHIQIVNGRILTGSQTEWRQISAAMQSPVEKAKEEISKNFTAIQREAVGSLMAMGFTRPQASELVTATEKGLPFTSQAGALGQVLNPTPRRRATGGRTGAYRLPGRGTLDTVKMADGGYGAPGELVLNQHTERDVDQDLIMAHRPTLEQRVRAETRKHSDLRRQHGGRVGAAVAAGATQGYTYPFPPGTRIGRTDQGVDANMPVGAPIGPMGPAVVKNITPNWYAGQPFVWWQLTGGPRAGQYAFVAEQITDIARPGTHLAPNQAVARYAPSGTGIEYGWATASGSTLAKATTGYTEGQVTPAGVNMRQFIAGLQHGRLVGGTLGMAGAGMAPQQISPLRAPRSRLRGIPGVLSTRAGQLYAKGLTQKINQHLGADGAVGGAGPAGGWVRVGATIDPTMGQPSAGSGPHGGLSFAELLVAGANAGLRADDLAATLGLPNGQYGMPEGTSILARRAGGGQAIRIWKNDVGSGQTGDPHYKIDLHSRIAAMLGVPGKGDIEVHRALGGRMGSGPTWGGWNARGTDVTVNRPTVFGAGESGPERVRITPHGGGGHAIHIARGAVQVNAAGGDPRAIQRYVDRRLQQFAQEVADEIASGAEEHPGQVIS